MLNIPDDSRTKITHKSTIRTTLLTERKLNKTGSEFPILKLLDAFILKPHVKAKQKIIDGRVHKMEVTAETEEWILVITTSKIFLSSYGDRIINKLFKTIDPFVFYKLFKNDKIKEESYKLLVEKDPTGCILDPRLSIEVEEMVDPTVSSFLKKVITSKNVIEKGVLKEIAVGLQKVITEDELIKIIFKAAQNITKLVTFQSEVTNTNGSSGDSGGYANTEYEMVIGGVVDQPYLKTIDTIIHEQTHLLMLWLFNNSFKPYNSGYLVGEKELEGIAIEISKADKSKHHGLFTSGLYNSQDYLKELPAYYMGEKAGKIVDTGYRKDEYSVSDSEQIGKWIDKNVTPVIKAFGELADFMDLQPISEPDFKAFIQGLQESLHRAITGDSFLSGSTVQDYTILGYMGLDKEIVDTILAEGRCDVPPIGDSVSITEL